MSSLILRGPLPTDPLQVRLCAPPDSTVCPERAVYELMRGSDCIGLLCQSHIRELGVLVGAVPPDRRGAL